MSNSKMKTGMLVGVAAVAAIAAGQAGAAEVFAEPVSNKGQSGYALSVFPAAGEEGVSFTFQLGQGLKNVDLSKCGREKADGVAKCLYEPSTGKLAVVLFRLDGEPLAAQEYSLGEVTFSGARLKLSPLEAQDVVSAARGGREAASAGRHSKNAEQ